MFLDKELLEDRLKDVLADFAVAAQTGVVENNPETLARLLADEVYNVLSELDSDDDDGWSATYDPEDEEWPQG